MNQDGTHGLSSSDLLRYPGIASFDLNTIVQKLVYLRQHQHPDRKIAVILDLGKELPKTWADPHQIECAIHALFARSLDAIIESEKPHGTITVRTTFKRGKIQLSITDDGIPASRRFNAFSRTPQEDMSITTCAEIVQDQDGELYAWRPSHPALTTIVVDLPAEVGWESVFNCV
jgi:hypothetical protein